MKYTIFSIDYSRLHYIQKMLPKLDGWEHVRVRTVDGRDIDELREAQTKHTYPINWDARLGHLGIWYSVLNAIEKAPIVTFEDDALLHDDFQMNFEQRVAELPDDWDFFSLFIPRDSDKMFDERRDGVSRSLTKVYQRYGGVSMMYSEQGAQKIRALLERDGLTGQYDDTLYAYAKAGELNGYCSKPTWADLVYITGLEKSIVQETDFI
ncbi:glycosyltransferase [Streptomyces phage Jay2Jay]|uniref:Glycosyltransferase n=2 Tax=Samistivirus jay2jay TaxID=2560786 RepID=A0A221SAT5_9CAUD|nr:glycosyltransferase [Streptomyces phage Jay2Jay]AIW02538.1 glycosyltransferase [Streptomyces phage Jay2Jay]ASN73114.1 glycosyltransferase [Streptomyces phage Warpy]